MKKIISILLVISLLSTSFVLSGCGDEEITLSDRVETKVTAYQTDLEDSVDSIKAPEDFTNFLTNWAKAKSIVYQQDDNNNVIMDVETSEAYAEAPRTVVVCPYDALQPENSISTVSIGLFLAKNSQETGRLRVIFVDNTGNNLSGIKGLDSSYFEKNDNVISLASGSHNVFTFNTGAMSSYEFAGTAEYTDPTKDLALKIKISDLGGGVPDNYVNSYPNPLKRLGNLLAQFKSNALIYELADFSGGESGSLYADSAEMTILIETDDYTKFQKKLDSEIKKFDKKYSDDYPEMMYTYEVVETPKKVFTQDSTNQFVSLIYTLLHGTYADDEEDYLEAFTNIGRIERRDNKYIIYASSFSRTKESMEEMDNNYELICSLSDISYKKVDEVEGFNRDEAVESQLATDMGAAFTEFSGKSIKFQNYVAATSANLIAQKNSECNLINLSVNKLQLARYAGTIVTFMLNQPHVTNNNPF